MAKISKDLNNKNKLKNKFPNNIKNKQQNQKKLKPTGKEK